MRILMIHRQTRGADSSIFTHATKISSSVRISPSYDSPVTHLKLVDDDSHGTGGDGKARVKPKKSSRQLHHSPTASFAASHWTRDRCGAF